MIKKSSLVSSGKVKKPILEGGLQIKDLKLQNIALGSKILWNLIAGKICWTTQVQWKKYFSGPRLKSLDKEPKTKNGSNIFSL